jgi:hypothetical protein
MFISGGMKVMSSSLAASWYTSGVATPMPAPQLGQRTTLAWPDSSRTFACGSREGSITVSIIAAN